MSNDRVRCLNLKQRLNILNFKAKQCQCCGRFGYNAYLERFPLGWEVNLSLVSWNKVSWWMYPNHVRRLPICLWLLECQIRATFTWCQKWDGSSKPTRTVTTTRQCCGKFQEIQTIIWNISSGKRFGKQSKKDPEHDIASCGWDTFINWLYSNSQSSS